eukprot:gene33041-55610_t
MSDTGDTDTGSSEATAGYDDLPGLFVEIGTGADAGIATVTIDSPPINLFTVELFLRTATLAQRLAVDPAVRVVVFRSANPEFFIAHFDVAAILTFPTDSPEPTELN